MNTPERCLAFLTVVITESKDALLTQKVLQNYNNDLECERLLLHYHNVDYVQG
jgi:hypothetical protein